MLVDWCNWWAITATTIAARSWLSAYVCDGAVVYVVKTTGTMWGAVSLPVDRQAEVVHGSVCRRPACGGAEAR